MYVAVDMGKTSPIWTITNIHINNRTIQMQDAEDIPPPDPTVPVTCRGVVKSSRGIRVILAIL